MKLTIKFFEMFGRLLIILSVLFVCGKSSHYACPPTSLCVPSIKCPEANVTFNPIERDSSQKYDVKYVCGVFPECEGFVCCSEPVDLEVDFKPNKTHWYYVEEAATNSNSIQSSVVVHPYPGLGEETSNNKKKESVATLCPVASACVPSSVCPQKYITFSFGVSSIKEYTCGNSSDTTGHICCLIEKVGHFPKEVVNENLPPIFMKPDENLQLANKKRKRSINFRLLIESATGRYKVVKEAKKYKEISARSFSQESTDWTCGRTLSLSRELQRIYSPIGDREAGEGDYPWQVAILSTNFEYLCSGVIVGEKTVVSIAHCFDKHRSPIDILVRVGDLDLQYETESNPAFDVKVALLFIHPDYESVKLESDIALLELQESVRGLPHIRPVCLPSAVNYSPAINQCKVSGWGQFTQSKEEKNEFSFKLRAASFYIIDKTQCQNELRKAVELGPFFKLQKSVICAKGYSNSDTCKGDGGSGLVCRSQDVYILRGLVSYGLGCGYNLPGVYTDVESNLDFINNYKTYSKHTSGGYKVHKDKVIKINEVPKYDVNENIPVYIPNDYEPKEPVYHSDNNNYYPKEVPEVYTISTPVYNKPANVYSSVLDDPYIENIYSPDNPIYQEPLDYSYETAVKKNPQKLPSYTKPEGLYTSPAEHHNNEYDYNTPKKPTFVEHPEAYDIYDSSHVYGNELNNNYKGIYESNNYDDSSHSSRPHNKKPYNKEFSTSADYLEGNNQYDYSHESLYNDDYSTQSTSPYADDYLYEPEYSYDYSDDREFHKYDDPREDFYSQERYDEYSRPDDIYDDSHEEYGESSYVGNHGNNYKRPGSVYEDESYDGVYTNIKPRKESDRLYYSDFNKERPRHFRSNSGDSHKITPKNTKLLKNRQEKIYVSSAVRIDNYNNVDPNLKSPLANLKKH